MGSNGNGNLDIDVYKSIFSTVSEAYLEYTHNWLENTGVTTYDLNRSIGGRFIEDTEELDINFLKCIRSFNSDLNLFQFNLLTKIKDAHDIKITSRVKDESSILGKLYKYHIEDGKGKYALDGCLNDLFGIRIIDNNYNQNIIKINKYINDKSRNKGIKARGIKRDKEEYKGYHVYIKGKNKRCFPMEIQIWDTQHEKNNLDAHSLYKKDYTLWTRKYEE